MLLEHLARYYFATPYVRGRVLDIACGSGYGCHMIAKDRKRELTELVGVDNDAEALAYANREYNHQKVTYRQADALDPKLPEELGVFDAILSFETLEHVADDQLFMDNLYRLLKPGGTLVVSTPFGRGRGMPTSEPFHVHQLTPEEFHELCGRFDRVEMFYQRGPTFEREPRTGVRYFIGIAVCTKA
ncbi:class I SAM-dependent methyltransferase [Tumebacillus permanentifrigoris]|nr:class I SAM-dependent methyltransferase [Tumebacillus permanentifrigoris]